MSHDHNNFVTKSVRPRDMKPCNADRNATDHVTVDSGCFGQMAHTGMG